MAIRIKSRGGEGVEQMMRRFKKLCEKEGLTKEVKRRQYYEKPSERARRDLRRAEKRAEMLVLAKAGLLPKGKRPGPGGPRRGGGGGGGGGRPPRS